MSRFSIGTLHKHYLDDKVDGHKAHISVFQKQTQNLSLDMSKRTL
jgi:hypothetical protein